MLKKILENKKLLSDIILIAVLLVVGLSALLIYELSKEPVDVNSAYVVVSQYPENVEIERIPLSENGVHVINGGKNIIRIEDGRVWMIESNCPDKNSKDGCVTQGDISKKKEAIICLPNKIIIELVGDSVEEGDVDFGT